MKYAEIEFGFFDTTAKDDGSFSSSDGKSFVDLTQLDNDNTSVDYYMDNQWNYTILDGTYNVLGTEEYGFVSNAMSDEDGDFTTNPVITREYNNNHTTRGLGFLFSEEGCPKQVKLTYYNGSSQLAQYTEDVSSNLYFVEHEVQDYDKWTIELIGTKIPYRNAQLIEVYYGVYISWTDEDIINCNIIEELDLASNELPIKELSFEVKDFTGQFNILNPDGLYSSLKEGQPLSVKEYIDGVKVPMGMFYLESWESTTGNIARFTAHDIIGELDKYEFVQNAMYNNTIITDVFDEILGDIEYDIDSELPSELINGYIPICTKREALQELCFSSRCYCISGRDNKLHFRRLNTTDEVGTIGKDISADMQTTLGDTINEVDVEGNLLFMGANEEIWRKTYNETSNNLFVVNYDTPAINTTLHYAVYTGSSVEEKEDALLRMKIQANTIYNPNEDNEIWITGQKITSIEKKEYTTKDSSANVLYPVEVKDLYLITYNNAQDLADYLYNIYQMKISQEFKLLLSNQQIGDRVSVAVGDYTKIGRIVKLDIDLANGFIANAKVVSEV